MWTVCKGLSEYPLKRIYNFKGLSVRPSIGYPLQMWVFAKSLLCKFGNELKCKAPLEVIWPLLKNLSG